MYVGYGNIYIYKCTHIVLGPVAVCHMHSAACQILIMPSKNEWKLASLTLPKWKMQLKEKEMESEGSD